MATGLVLWASGLVLWASGGVVWVSVSWLGVTCREGVTNISRVTLADGILVFHRTCGVGSTHTLTWVTTLVVLARLVVWTVCIGFA